MVYEHSPVSILSTVFKFVGAEITMENLFANKAKVLLIEPFYGGSHRDLMDNLTESLRENGIKYTLVTLSAKKWHWRARCGALVLREKIPKPSAESVLFCSSVLNLAELLGLRLDLHTLKKIVYFHENQLVYPVQQIKCRDVQYAYNQITTSLSADLLLFNSHFNRISFLQNINKIIKLFPDNKPKHIKEQIEAKSRVLYFPVNFPKDVCNNKRSDILRIVWPHRWEFDKCPEEFFSVMLKLKQEKHIFQISVLGETYTDKPEIFDNVKAELSTEIVHFGYLENKKDYFEVLSSSHVVVSTAKHEFFGVSVLEAAYCGCLPVLPRDLVYPEMYPSECLYNDLDELYQMLKKFCLEPNLAIHLRSEINIDFQKYSKNVLLPEYLNILQGNI